METFKICVPAIIYAIQNNLYYIALANLDATLYSVRSFITFYIIYSLKMNKNNL